MTSTGFAGALARAHGYAAYAHFEDRYHDMTRLLEFDGHTAWAEIPYPTTAYAFAIAHLRRNPRPVRTEGRRVRVAPRTSVLSRSPHRWKGIVMKDGFHGSARPSAG